MASYLIQHRQNILQEAPLAKAALTKGMIARVRYKKLNNKSKEYWLLILQPKYIVPGESNTLLHALDLDALSLSDFFRLVERLGIVGSRSLWRNRRLDIDKLQLDMSSKRFYLGNIKAVKNLGNCYKTFIWDNISSSRVCNYNFGDSFEDIEYLGMDE